MVQDMGHQKQINAPIESNEKVCKQTTEVMEKAESLRKLMRPDIQMTDEEVIELVKDVEQLKVEMEENKKEMKRTQREFMTAHSTTLEVLWSAGKVKLTRTRFNAKGERQVRCMFCTMAFDQMEVRKQHILVYHWKDMETTVSSNIIIQVDLLIIHFNTHEEI